MSPLNAGPVGRPRLQQGQAGIDRPCTTEYRPSQDVITDHEEKSGLLDKTIFNERLFKFVTSYFHPFSRNS